MVKCTHCNKKVADKRNQVISNGTVWHKWCIRCDDCGIRYQYNKDKFTLDNPEGHGISHVGCKKPICMICTKPLGRFKTTTINGYDEKVHEKCVNMYRIKVYGCENTYEECENHDVDYDENPVLVYNFEPMWPVKWSPVEHKNYPREFRESVFTFLLVMNRIRAEIRMVIPKDIRFMLIQMLTTPHVWPTWNGLDPSRLCTNTRCSEESNCRTCDGLVQQISSDMNVCSKNKCLFYQFKCNNCDRKVGYNDDHEHVCTKYRCINRQCHMCNGPIRCCKNHQENLCSKIACSTYLSTMCKCGSYLLRQPTDPSNCTKYRCGKSRCKKCGSTIRMHNDDNTLCSLNSCIVNENRIEGCLREICTILDINYDTYFENRTLDQKIVLIKSDVFRRFDPHDISDPGLMIIMRLISLI